MLIGRDRAARTIYISQEAFINALLVRYNLTGAVVPGKQLAAADCPASQEEKDDMVTRPYRELVGALAWLALGTRPDIAFVMGSLARFGHSPGRVHWDAAKRVLRYLKGVRGWRLRLGGEPPRVMVYTDADWGILGDWRSVGAYVAKVGCCAFSWKMKEQTCVALSSTEAEYVALCQAAKESVSGLPYRTLWWLVKAGKIGLTYVPTEKVLADALTKSLPRAQHEYLARGVGLL